MKYTTDEILELVYQRDLRDTLRDDPFSLMGVERVDYRAVVSDRFAKWLGSVKSE